MCLFFFYWNEVGVSCEAWNCVTTLFSHNWKFQINFLQNFSFYFPFYVSHFWVFYFSSEQETRIGFPLHTFMQLFKRTSRYFFLNSPDISIHFFFGPLFLLSQRPRATVYSSMFHKNTKGTYLLCFQKSNDIWMKMLIYKLKRNWRFLLFKPTWGRKNRNKNKGKNIEKHEKAE